MRTTRRFFYSSVGIQGEFRQRSDDDNSSPMDRTDAKVDPARLEAGDLVF